MNIRMAIGFMAGVLVVVGLWWMLQGKKVEKKDLAAGSTNPAASLDKSPEIKAPAEPALPVPEKIRETAQAVQPSETPASQNLPDSPLENQAATTAPGEKPADEEEKPADEEAEIRPEDPQTAVSPVLPAPSDPGPETALETAPEPGHETGPGTSSIVSETADPVLPENPASETESGLVPETSDLEKHFFWKPFSLESKAEKFAGYISDNSGVDCRVEKTGVGQYQVYYLYEDEADQAVKIALIKKTGLKL